MVFAISLDLNLLPTRRSLTLNLTFFDHSFDLFFLITDLGQEKFNF